jgi:hypothetical protein
MSPWVPASDVRETRRKVVAIVQSNYIPWKGYFDLIASADELILFDDMQYTRRDWRNRNKIKTPQGPQWLTIPVQVKGMYHQRIDATRVADKDWASRHWQSIQHSYARAPHFARYKALFEELYLGQDEAFLSRINYHFLTAICSLLGIPARITWSTDYESSEGKTERLVHLCRQAGATHYLSGPSARDYIDAELFRQAGIVLCFSKYSGYPEYPQLYPPFDHAVSVIDLLFNTGPEAPRYLLTRYNASVGPSGEHHAT